MRLILTLALYALLECAFLLVFQWAFGVELSTLATPERFVLLGINTGFIFVAILILELHETYSSSGTHQGLRSDWIDMIVPKELRTGRGNR